MRRVGNGTRNVPRATFAARLRAEVADARDAASAHLITIAQAPLATGIIETASHLSAFDTPGLIAEAVFTSYRAANEYYYEYHHRAKGQDTNDHRDDLGFEHKARDGLEDAADEQQARPSDDTHNAMTDSTVDLPHNEDQGQSPNAITQASESDRTAMTETGAHDDSSKTDSADIQQGLNQAAEDHLHEESQADLYDLSEASNAEESQNTETPDRSVLASEHAAEAATHEDTEVEADLSNEPRETLEAEQSDESATGNTQDVNAAEMPPSTLTTKEDEDEDEDDDFDSM